ncbi:MAG: ABC transporter substrate-binding protein [bacterium]|nr:ABC transporter substrate-binding protein [bacterium]
MKSHITVFLIALLFLTIFCKQQETKIEIKKASDEDILQVLNLDGDIIIGLNLPYTGPYASQGIDELRAFKLAINDINKQGGILGKKIGYIVKDTMSKPNIAAKNAEELIDRHKAVLITGGVSSSVAIAVGKVCQKKKILFLATVTHSDATTGKSAQRYMFRKCTSATMDARALASILARHYSQNTSYAYITADYTWGLSTEAAMRKVVEASGAKTLKAIRVPLGTKDFSGPLAEVKKLSPDMIVLVLFGDDLVTAIKQATTMGIKKKIKLIVVPYIELNMAIKAGPEAISGIIASVPWVWQLEDEYKNAKIFVTNYYKQYNKYPSNVSESAYVNIMEFANAVKREQSFNSTKIVASLEEHSFRGLKNHEYWRKWDHQSIQTIFLVKGNSVEKMKNPSDFFKIIYRVDGEKVARTKKENPVSMEAL